MSDKKKLMSLKIMVDTKNNKVVFAEASKAFVDFIIHILSLPLASVVKLLNENNKQMTGSLSDLYKSIDSLGDVYLETNTDKSSVLMPPVVEVPMLSPRETSFIRYYTCTDAKNHAYMPSAEGYASYRNGSSCPGCGKSLVLQRFRYVPGSINGVPLYVKGPVSFVVMDNLEVKPMSVSLITSLLKDFTDSVVEKEVRLGRQEGIAILKASLETKSVLTSVFLDSKGG